MTLRISLLAGLAAAVLLAPAARAERYTFEGLLGASDPFSIGTGTQRVSFTSPTGPGTFAVASTAGLFTFPLGLADFGSFSGDILEITFAMPVASAIIVPFGILDTYGLYAPNQLILTADTGQQELADTHPNGLLTSEPEGMALFLPRAAVTRLTITSAAPYAIGEVDVPEPMSVAVLAAGLLGVAAVRRRLR